MCLPEYWSGEISTQPPNWGLIWGSRVSLSQGRGASIIKCHHGALQRPRFQEPLFHVRARRCRIKHSNAVRAAGETPILSLVTFDL